MRESQLNVEYHKIKLRNTIDDMWTHWELHEALLEDIIHVSRKWSKTENDYLTKERCVSVTYAASTHSINGVALDLYLGPDDNITKDIAMYVEEFIEPIAEKHCLAEVRAHDFLEIGWTGYLYFGEGKRLLIRAWFENSNKCKLIETGEITKVMKIECSS